MVGSGQTRFFSSENTKEASWSRKPGGLRRGSQSIPVTASIQESLYPFSTCFGFGPANPQGLQIRSFTSEGSVVASVQPGEHHSDGMGSLNGGVIATLLDRHSGSAVFSASAAESESGSDFQPWVTTGLQLRYRLPTFLDQPSQLVGVIDSKDSGVMTVKATLSYEGKVRVQAESRWVRIG